MQKTAGHSQSVAALTVPLFIFGLCIAAAASLWLRNSINSNAQTEFQSSSARITAQISLRLSQSINGLKSASGLYAATQGVNRSQFRSFIESRDLTRDFPGVRGFGFIQRVPRWNVENFVAAARADGAPQFAIRELDDRSHPELYVIKYLEPAAQNIGAHGLDVGSEARRREAAERAIDSGEPALTSVITLVQDSKQTPGALLFLPVFAPGAPATNPAQRRASLIGLLYAPIVYAELFNGMSGTADHEVNVEIIDVASSATTDAAFSQVYHTTPDTGRMASQNEPHYKSVERISIFSRDYTLRLYSSPQFDAAVSYKLPWLVFGGGSLVSLLLAMMLWQQASGRRRAEELARNMTANLDRMAQVAQHTSDAVSITDCELRIVWVNAGFTRVNGYTITQALGKTHGELLGSGKADPVVLRLLAEAAANHAPCGVEILNRAQDGREYWCDLEFQPMFDAQGQLAGFMEIARDITSRKTAALALKAMDAELRNKNEMMREIIANLPCGLSVFDAQLNLAASNMAFRRALDLPDSLFEGTKTRFEDMLAFHVASGEFGADEATIKARMQRALAVHEPQQYELTRPDGRLLEVRGAPMPDGGMVRTYTDITALVGATKTAQEASSAKSRILANMSHEIRTPMNAILGMLALLRKTDLSKRQADYAAKSEGAARSLLGLLNEILDFSKIEAGKMTLDPHPFRIDQLLRDLSVIFSASIGAKPVEVLFDIDPALPRHLVGDMMRLQQVLINLAGNAIKFTAEGDVVLSMAVTQLTDAHVTLDVAVRDSGIGIAAENQERIFSGFTQAESSTTRRFGGTGLGLALSQRLVALMGGDLKLESALGRGSRFYFSVTLPIAPDISAGEPASAPPTTLRALVVDDNASSCRVLKRMGESLGWTVDAAESGARALEMLGAQAAAGIAYQAVFVDWQMPVLDGWETSRRIRDLGLSGEAPVVVMVTAHDREMLSQRSQNEQAMLDGFLVKPVTASMLFDAVVDARSSHTLPHPSHQATASAVARLRGMRLLLVEDNANNQQVARELLEHEGASVQIANNGQEGVEAVAAADPPFDVVLMDLQMPVMDGLTATSRIRTDLGLISLPIVAMTANAMASDREACLAAGMNDHVGKPFNLDNLVQVLKKHAGSIATTEGNKSEQSVPDNGERNIIAAISDLPAPMRNIAAMAGIQIEPALRRMGGKQDIYGRMLGNFIKDLALMSVQLRSLIEEGDTVSAARLMHTLKGVAATLGADALSAVAASCEKQLNTQPAAASDAIGPACAAIDAAGAGFETLLQELLSPQSTQAGPAMGLDDRMFIEALSALAGQLRNADMAATDAMAELRRRCGPDFASKLAPLQEAIGNLEFELALQICNELIEGQPA